MLNPRNLSPSIVPTIHPLISVVKKRPWQNSTFHGNQRNDRRRNRRGNNRRNDSNSGFLQSTERRASIFPLIVPPMLNLRNNQRNQSCHHTALNNLTLLRFNDVSSPAMSSQQCHSQVRSSFLSGQQNTFDWPSQASGSVRCPSGPIVQLWATTTRSVAPFGLRSGRCSLKMLLAAAPWLPMNLSLW